MTIPGNNPEDDKGANVRNYPILVIPAEAGIQGKRSPYVFLDIRVKPEDDGPTPSCHSRGSGNPKCRGTQDYKDFSPLDLRVKPEDDKRK